MRYDVVLVGYRLNASLKPAEALHRVLGLDLETCKALTRQFPATVLSGISESRAHRVADELTELGGKLEVRESRLSGSLGSSPSSAPNEESGNYAIGEILAPMSRGSVAPPKSSAESVAKRPSREALDEALRESFPPARSVPPSSISVAPPPPSLELDGAFAGLSNFEDTLGTRDLPPLEVDEVAMRAIRRSSRPPAAMQKPPTFWARLATRMRRLSASSLEWAVGLVWLLVVATITIAAVGWALDPRNVFGVLGVTKPARDADKLRERDTP